jgi:hypothetical protein
MAQSDQVVQNATFPSVRADINNNLAALYSQNSGNSAPTVTVAFQPWVDTSSSPPVWKVRNSSNSGWITIGVLDPAGFNAGGVTAIANGGTGQTTAAAALTALLPSQSGNVNKALVTDGTAAAWQTVNARSTIEILTTSASWLCPAGVTKAFITVIGGGGAGGSGSAGTAARDGGSGGCSGVGIGQITLIPGEYYTITIGAGGVGSSGNNGTSGGNSSFIGLGVSITATGGAGGGRGVAGTTGGTGADGSCSSTDANLRRNTIRGTVLDKLPTNTTASGATSFSSYAITDELCPGSGGVGGNAASSGSPLAGSGGAYGVVILEYLN